MAAYLWADCTLGSAPGPMLGNEYGKTLPFTKMTAICHIEFLNISTDTRIWKAYVSHEHHQQFVNILIKCEILI